MYPRYSIDDTLNMYASQFFLLLAEGYRIRYRNYQMLTTIAMLPNVEGESAQSQRESFIDMLSVASQDPRDILNSDTINDDNSGIEILKEFL